MKKIVLTGGTGLIGKEAIEPLINQGFDVYAFSSKSDSFDKRIHCLKVDLFDYKQIESAFKSIEPEYLLHFAWCTTGDYLSSELNYNFLDASLNMLNIFAKTGGKRAVFAGTCFEYKFKDEPLKETDEVDPQTIYAKCKNELRVRASTFCLSNNISFGWGRIFYVFGHGEDKNRLMPYIIDTFKKNKNVYIKSSELIRDYIYSKDIATAFIKLIDEYTCDCVNICTGNAISIGNYATTIAKRLNKKHLLICKNQNNNDPKMIVGDTKILEEKLGFISRYNFSTAIGEILSNE